MKEGEIEKGKAEIKEEERKSTAATLTQRSSPQLILAVAIAAMLVLKNGVLFTERCKKCCGDGTS